MKQFIICPNCGSIELAEVDTTTVPWNTYIHHCSKCEYIIMESDWNWAPCLSVRQPWASLIVEGIKDIENRTWKLPEKYKGKRVLIHAGIYKKLDKMPLGMVFSKEQLSELCLNFTVLELCTRLGPFGAIIGSVEIVDCVINHESIWAEESKILNLGMLKVECQPPVYNWVLKNPIKFDTSIQCKGQLSFFKPKI